LKKNDLEPPQKDEIEISIFGPGIGECVVLHLGNNDWVIFDSCLDKSSKEPVAFQYLTNFGIPIESAVKMIAVTHWHDDHIRGSSRLVKSCKESIFVCPTAFFLPEFKKFINVFHTRFLSLTSNSGTDEFADIFKVLFERYPGRRPQPVNLKYACADRCILRLDSPHRPFKAEIHSLAPSDAALSLARASFGNQIPQDKTIKRRAIAVDNNDASSAFHVIINDLIILLGGDVLIGQNSDLGWQAIVKSNTKHQGKAFLVKIPHHGSGTAYYKPMWEKMVVANPIAIATPFASGRKPLPSDKDISQLKGHTQDLFCTGRPKGWKPRRLDSMAEKFSSTIVESRRRIEGPMGHICVRMSHPENNPKIYLHQNAEKL
jgi:hypothetical protein